MATVMTHFDNLKVSRKLGAGFGFLLLAVLAVAFVGHTSNTLLVDRLDTTRLVGTLNDAVQTMRRTEKQYEVAADPRYVVTYREHLGVVQGLVSKALATMQRAENQAALRQLQASTADYDQTVQRLIDNDTALAAALEPLGQRSEAYAQTLSSLVESATASALQAPEPASIRSLRSMADLGSAMAQFRLMLRRYITDPGSANQHALFSTTDALLGELASTRTQLPAQQASQLEAVHAGMRQYRAVLLEVQALFEQKEKLRQQVDQYSGAMDKTMTGLMDTQQRLARDDQHNALLQIAGLSLLALLAGLFAAVAIARQITVPLSVTVELARRIAKGDLTPQAKSARRDELGELQNTVLDMAHSLNALVKGIGSGVTHISTSAEKLSAMSEQTSAGVRQQKVEVDQVATAMHEMASTVQEVARNTTDASAAATLAEEQARHGGAVVKQATRQISELSDAIEALGGAMNTLTQDSEQIGKVIDVIKAVAEQTNLLALNAAIEAARAGEQGRGFAVVADEVRSLAQRTQNSTQEIETLITALQQGTQAASTLMVSSRERTLDTVALAQKAEHAIGEINQSIGTIQQMSLQISAAAEQQSAVADEINKSIINVRDVADQSATASQHSAAATLELVSLGQDLQRLTSHFRT